MKQFAWSLALIFPILLTACGNDAEFQGRFIGPDGMTSYEFLPEGKLQITQQENVTTAVYEYDSKGRVIKLTTDTNLPSNNLTVNDVGHLETGDITLTRGVDYSMLADTTWIGHQGQYTFALTFNMTDKGLETFSELVTYHDEDMTYVNQTDDSITRLSGNMLLLDLTQYTVSEVTEDSFKLTIGNNSMVMEKHPKGTEIDLRNDYQSIDEQS